MALLCGAAVGGCSRSVEVPAPTPDAETATLCVAFTGALPDELPTVGARRDVTPSPELTAAYGDPPVGVRCGVPDPATLSSTALLVRIDGIDWFPQELTAGWRMTSVGRAANVELTVPSEQGPAPSVAADLSTAITTTIPAEG